jgi:hypothetical protein
MPLPASGFPRSFLFSAHELPLPAGLHPASVPFGCLGISDGYGHCAVQMQSRGRPHALVMIGHCFDARDPAATMPDIAERLLAIAARDGAKAMLAATDELTGRYTAICRIDGETLVFHDACATRSTYFSETLPIVASHSTLIGEITGARSQRELFLHFRYGLPGNLAPIEGVRILPANFALDLSSRKPFRYWPRTPRVEAKTEHAVEAAHEIVARSVEAIATRWRPVVSVTAGIDSRVSLAAFRNTPDVLCFTYNRGKPDAIDVAVASELCRRLGKPHRSLRIVGRRLGQRVYDAIALMDDYRHFKAAGPIYAVNFRNPRNIHVRSNLAEIGRAFWRRNIGGANFGAARMARIIEQRRGAPGHEEAMRLCRSAMTDYLKLLAYDLSDADDPRLLGYDAWDLYYWEHRMTTWHAQVLLGSDFAFDTTILFNSRRLLEHLLSVPLDHRAKGAVFHALIRRLWPEAAEVPINPTDVPVFAASPEARADPISRAGVY